MSKCVVALSLALSVAGFAVPVRAQQDPVNRDAATAHCIDMAQTQYPQGSSDNQAGRVVTYQACMKAAGFKP